MKIKNQRILKNGAIGAYVYQPDKTWKWRIIGKQKGSGSKENNLSETRLRVGMRYPNTRIPQLLNRLGISLNNAIHILDAAGCGPNGLDIENRNGISEHPIHITCEQYDILSAREADIRAYADNLRNINREPPQNPPKPNKKQNNGKSNA